MDISYETEPSEYRHEIKFICDLELATKLTKYFGDLFSQLTTTLFVCISAVLSIIILYNGVFHESYGNYLIYEWISSGDFIVNWSINIDPLSSIMLVVVCLVSALVHIYSIGYMEPVSYTHLRAHET